MAESTAFLLSFNPLSRTYLIASSVSSWTVITDLLVSLSFLLAELVTLINSPAAAAAAIDFTLFLRFDFLRT